MKRIFPAIDQLASERAGSGSADAEAGAEGEKEASIGTDRQLELIGSVNLSSFSPTQLAQVEQILYPNSHGEAMMKTWSSLQLQDAEQLQRFWQLFAANDEKFAVTLYARSVSSRLDAHTVKWCIRSGQELRGIRFSSGKTMADSVGSSGSGSGSRTAQSEDGLIYPVIIVPEILLRVDADAEDIFRALMVVHRISFDFRRRSVPLTAAQAMDAKRRLPRVRHELLPTLGYGGDDMWEAVRAAYEYEQQHRNDVLQLLQAAGWDTGRFMFGSIRRRVEW